MLVSLLSAVWLVQFAYSFWALVSLSITEKQCQVDFPYMVVVRIKLSYKCEIAFYIIRWYAHIITMDWAALIYIYVSIFVIHFFNKGIVLGHNDYKTN